MRLGGLPLKGTRTHVILLPVGLAVVGWSWVASVTDVCLGATFGELITAFITAFGANGLDMLAVRDMGMLRAAESRLDVVLALT